MSSTNFTWFILEYFFPYVAILFIFIFVYVFFTFLIILDNRKFSFKDFVRQCKQICRYIFLYIYYKNLLKRTCTVFPLKYSSRQKWFSSSRSNYIFVLIELSDCQYEKVTGKLFKINSKSFRFSSYFLKQNTRFFISNSIFGVNVRVV